MKPSSDELFQAKESDDVKWKPKAKWHSRCSAWKRCGSRANNEIKNLAAAGTRTAHRNLKRSSGNCWGFLSYNESLGNISASIQSTWSVTRTESDISAHGSKKGVSAENTGRTWWIKNTWPKTVQTSCMFDSADWNWKGLKAVVDKDR